MIFIGGKRWSEEGSWTKTRQGYEKTPKRKKKSKKCLEQVNLKQWMEKWVEGDKKKGNGVEEENNQGQKPR